MATGTLAELMIPNILQLVILMTRHITMSHCPMNETNDASFVRTMHNIVTKKMPSHNQQSISNLNFSSGAH